MAESSTLSVSPIAEISSELARLQSRVAALQALQDVARNVTAELDLTRLLHNIVGEAASVMHCTAGSLLLFDPATAELVFEVVEGGGGAALEKTRIPSAQGIGGAAFTQREPVIVNDVASDTRYLTGVAEHYGINAQKLLAVPLMAKGETIGVLEVLNKTSGEDFTAEDRDLLLAFASQSAIAIENARLYQSVVSERDRILAVEASVRHELARDLHDGPAQLLSSIIMSLRFLREVMQRAPERTDTELTELEALAQKALYQVRNMLFDLRPVILETEGLGPALKAYVERLRLVEPYSIELTVDGLTARLNASAEAAIFSIVQEAVSNVKKHAAPAHLRIHASQRDSVITIRVQDDGRGFDVTNTEQRYAERNSFGLLNMRERAQIARGRLDIASQSGQGTTVTITVPLASVVSNQ